jgi:hypothetical protein
MRLAPAAAKMSSASQLSRRIGAASARAVLLFDASHLNNNSS